MRSCVGGSLRIVSFITCTEPEKETGKIVLVAMVVASLADLSANSMPGMAEWPGLHWMKMEDEMELIELQIDEVRGFDKMRASHNDLLSAQESIVFEWWLALMATGNCFLLVGAGEHSSFGFDGGNHFRLDWGSSSDNCCCAPVSCRSTNGSIGVNGVITPVWSNDGETVSAF